MYWKFLSGLLDISLFLVGKERKIFFYYLLVIFFRREGQMGIGITVSL